MSIKITKLIRRDKTNQLTGLEMAILVYLSEFASDEGTQIFPSVETIVAQTKFCRTSVKKALKGLEAKGRISKEGRKKGFRDISNLYQINLLEIAKAAGIALVDNNPDIPTGRSPHDLVGGRHATLGGSPRDHDQSLINHSFKNHCKKEVSVDNSVPVEEIKNNDFNKDKIEKRGESRSIALKANSKTIEVGFTEWKYCMVLTKGKGWHEHLSEFSYEEKEIFDKLIAYGIVAPDAVGMILTHQLYEIMTAIDEAKRRKVKINGAYIRACLLNKLREKGLIL